jgi:hypothetical protein
MNRLSWRGVAILATPAAVAVGCSNTSNSAAVGSDDAAVTDAAADRGDSSIGAIMELNGEGAGGGTNMLVCGAMTCSPPTGGMLPLSACCLPNNECGASVGGAVGGGGPCLNIAAGVPDPSCPTESAMGMSAPSCCSVEGVCGVDLSVINLGCNSLSALSAFVAVEAGPPQSCGDAGGSVPDAAASDAAASDAAAADAAASDAAASEG